MVWQNKIFLEYDALGLFVGVLLFIYFSDKYIRLYPVSPIFAWLNSNHNWHSWGHYLSQFTLTMVLYFTFYWPWYFLILPTVVATLAIEVGQNKGFKGLFTKFDFYFDFFTHVTGSVTAVLLIYP